MSTVEGLEATQMLKLSLIAMFVASLATLSFASSMTPVPQTTSVAPAPHIWLQTFE